MCASDRFVCILDSIVIVNNSEHERKLLLSILFSSKSIRSAPVVYKKH